MLKQVKTLLGMEVKLEQMKLENGTVLEAEKFEAGNEIFIVTEDERGCFTYWRIRNGKRNGCSN